MFIRSSFFPNMHELQLIRDSAALKHLFETHADPEGVIRLEERDLRGKGPAISHGLQYGKLRYAGKEGDTLVYVSTSSADNAGVTPQRAPQEPVQAL